MTSEEDKMNILVQLFWICIAVLESDYEHEFILGLRHIHSFIYSPFQYSSYSFMNLLVHLLIHLYIFLS